MDEDHEALGDDPAAVFEALRAEVAALRADLGGEGEGRAAPDYAPTLGKMAATLAKIEAHPALQLTPEAFGYQIRQAREAAQQQGGRELSAAIQRMDGAAANLARLAVQQPLAVHCGRHRRGLRRRDLGGFVGADRSHPAGRLERAGTDGRRDAAARSMGSRRSAYAGRQPAGLGEVG
jgi:hypothetical protein